MLLSWSQQDSHCSLQSEQAAALGVTEASVHSRLFFIIIAGWAANLLSATCMGTGNSREDTSQCSVPVQGKGTAQGTSSPKFGFQAVLGGLVGQGGKKSAEHTQGTSPRVFVLF